MNRFEKIFSVKIAILILLIIIAITTYEVQPLDPNSIGSNIFYYNPVLGILTVLLLGLGSHLLLRSSEIKNGLKRIVIHRKFLLTASILLILLFTFVAYKKHINLQTALFDFGLQHQAIWNTSEGRFFESSIEVKNFLGDHFSLFLVFVALLYKIFPHVLTLFLVQSMAVVIGGLGIYAFSQKLIKNNIISTSLFLLFVLSNSISANYIFDFHEITLAIPFLVWGSFFLYIKRTYLLTFILFSLALLTKEDVGIFVGSFSFFVFLEKRDKKALLVSLYGVLWTVASFLVFIPLIRGASSDSLIRYSQWGNTSNEILKNMLTRFDLWIEHLLSWKRISYTLKLFLPVGFLPLFSPLTLVFIIPCLLENLVSNYDAQLSGTGYYNAMTTIAIFIASIISIEKFSKKLPIEKIKRIIIFTLVPLNVTLFTWHPLPMYLLYPLDRYQDFAYIRELKQNLPKEAIIATTNMVGGQFGEFRNTQLFYPEWVEYKVEPEYIIIDKVTTSEKGALKKGDEFIDKGYKVYAENSSFIVLKQ